MIFYVSFLYNSIVNSLFVVVLSLVVFCVAYRFYGELLERIWEVNRDRTTPAVEKYDGIDYIPAKSWILLFGHHFASIAGAGPVIGPVIACVYWGWGPVLIWVLLGAIFLGGVHDFSTLLISIRHKGKTIGDVTGEVLNQPAKIIFLSFLLLALILVVSVFINLAAKTLCSEPRIVLPTFGLIFIAVLIGKLIYSLNVNQIIGTIVGLVLLISLLIIGNFLQVKSDMMIWIIILLVYCYFSSILPVNILLQPRDYLSSFLLFFGVVSGYLGLLLIRPEIRAPMFIKWESTEGSLWPMLLIFVACGAISGFHGLVSSGTTAKQIANETHAKKIAYGGMLCEGAVAILVILCVCTGLYWSSVPGISSELVYPELLAQKGPIITFGKGFGELTKHFFGDMGSVFGIIMLNTFIVTTLDTATRIARYIFEELFGAGLGIKLFHNRFISTVVLMLPVICLVCGGYWGHIWPIFGTANQLVAGLSFIVVTVYFLVRKRLNRTLIIPAIIVLTTTIVALICKTIFFIKGGKILLGSIAVILLILALLFIFDAIKMLRYLCTPGRHEDKEVKKVHS